VTSAFRPDADRLAALAEFAAGAGHEINNPLATIVGRAQQLLRDEPDPVRRQSLATIVAQAYRIRDMIGDVMAFARPPTPVLTSLDLSTLVRDVAATLDGDLLAVKCRTEFHGDHVAPLSADREQLAAVLSELVHNAAEALQPDGGLISLSVTSEADIVRLQVHDTGRGFSELEREHAFDPFFSGRSAGRGLGFGLCKVWQILRLHAGTVNIDSSPGGPTTVTVQLPLRWE
jgi:signal transduction histidine kinase